MTLASLVWFLRFVIHFKHFPRSFSHELTSSNLRDARALCGRRHQETSHLRFVSFAQSYESQTMWIQNRISKLTKNFDKLSRRRLITSS